LEENLMGSIYDTKDENYEEVAFSADRHNNLHTTTNTSVRCTMPRTHVFGVVAVLQACK